jgi:diketogulonate reductase-like aldo/keto reductase
LKLSSKTEIPQLALGLWKVINPVTVRHVVAEALQAGYRHFDSAQIYSNEGFLGSALQKSGIPRQEFFITTKISTINMAPGRLMASFDRSLKRLKTDYVDLLLLHFPVSKYRQDDWPLMEEIYRNGRAKAIGVSNYTVRHLDELLQTCQVKPAVNQVELHVFLQQSELLAYCQKQGIVVEAYSPLAHGNGLDEPVLTQIAQKHGKTPAQIMLRWCIEAGAVPLPKTTHADRLSQNLQVFDFKLDKSDLAAIKKLHRNLRICWDPTDTP